MRSTTQSPVTAAALVNPQRIEERPTFAGGMDVGSLLVLAGLSGAFGLAWYLLADWPPAWAVSAAAVLLVVLYCIYAAVATGLLHKMIEQTTERRRIDAAMMDVTEVNEVQQAMLDALRDHIRRIEARLDALSTIAVTDNTGTRTIPRVDAVDMRVRQWVVGLFDVAGQLTGTHPNGQIKASIPFKASASGDDLAGYRRLVAAGLLAKRDVNGGVVYVWTGPATLSASLARLDAVREGIT